MSYFNVISKSVLQEIKYHLPFYLLLTAILSLALFIRVYRAEDLLGFYYDQGRDALVIWRFWYNRDFFLIGPVTGLMGIYLGPFYYLLIAPLYLIGGGSPVYPAVFLSFLSVIALFILYLLGQEMHSKAGGLIAATIGGFSFYIFSLHIYIPRYFHQHSLTKRTRSSSRNKLFPRHFLFLLKQLGQGTHLF